MHATKNTCSWQKCKKQKLNHCIIDPERKESLLEEAINIEYTIISDWNLFWDDKILRSFNNKRHCNWSRNRLKIN